MALFVRNHGEGISATLFAAMVQPFVRGEYNRRKLGIGPRLAIVPRTSMRHGGSPVPIDAQPGTWVEPHLPTANAGDRSFKLSFSSLAPGGYLCLASETPGLQTRGHVGPQPLGS